MRRIVLTLTVLVLIMVMASSCASIKAKKFAELLDDDKYDEALALYRQVQNEAIKAQLEELVIARADKLRELFLNEVITHRNAYNALSKLGHFPAVQEHVRANQQFVDNINHSRASYRRATTFIGTDRFAAMLNSLAYAMEEDTHYFMKAQTLIEKTLTKMYDAKLAQAEKYYQQEDYADAAGCVANLACYFPEDKIIQEKLEFYNDLREQQSVRDQKVQELVVEVNVAEDIIITIPEDTVMGPIHDITLYDTHCIKWNNNIYDTHPDFTNRVHLADLETQIGEVERRVVTVTKDGDSTWLPVKTKLYKLQDVDTSKTIVYCHRGVYFMTDRTRPLFWD